MKGRYVSELWMGRAGDYWNWDIKGIADNDFVGRVELCDEYIEELKYIRGYYTRRAVDEGENKGRGDV